MKFKQLFIIALATLASTMFVACSSDDVDPEILPQEGKVNYFEKAIDFTSDGGSINVCFSTNVDWTLTASSTQGGTTWCNVSQSSGKAGDFSIVVTAEPNTGYDDRNVVLTLTADKVVKTVIVNQKQKNAITLTTNRFEVDKDGGSFDVVAKANVDYTVEIPSQYQSWISQSASTRGLTSKSLSFTVAKSEEYDKREGEILFKSGELTETTKVYQAGSAILVLSQNEYTIGSEGGTISIDISSNFDFVVDMPNVSWLKAADKTRAVSSHTLVYQIDPNTTYDDREAVIIFKDSKSDRRESVTIKQRQKNGILLSTPKAEIGQDGGTFYVEVNSNVDYQIEIPSSFRSWISRASSSVPTRALSKSTPAFKVSQNQEYAKREGEIYFKYGDIKETFKVYQSGGAILVLSQQNYSLGGEESTITVQMKSNIDYTFTISADWIAEVSTRALSSSSKYFKVSKNKTGSTRNGKITFTSSDGSRSAVVNIEQQSIIEAKSLKINLENTSGLMSGNMLIGKPYRLTVTPTPANAATDYEWTIEDKSIASISGSGNTVTLQTANFGKTKVTVTDKNSGVSSSLDIGTCVMDFRFTEDTGETMYGGAAITLVLGETYQLHYTCTPSYATRVFQDLRAFNFKEISPGSSYYAIVEKSSIVDIDENGLMTAKKVGTTIINSNNGYGVHKTGSNDCIFVKVITEYTETEYNNDFYTANVIKEGKSIKFRMSNTSDVDVFKFTNPDPYSGDCFAKITYHGDLSNSTSDNKHIGFETFNSNYMLCQSRSATFPSTGGTTTDYAWVNTKIGYIRFYIQDYWKTWQQGVPTGYFTVEIVTDIL